MRYLKICPNLFLVEQEIKQTKASAVRPDTINHVWIYDRSGSMSYVLPRLAEDLIARAKELPVGDTITLGWFSSEGQFDFMLKGFKITDAKDYSVLEKMIRQNKSPIGCTCFSEILHDTDKVVKDLSIISPNFALCFFTDGYPVVSNYSREIESIQTAITNLNGKIGASLLVGYGNYYNKELMSDMAERLGGALCHSSDLPTFSISLVDFISGARDVGGNLVVPLEVPEVQLAFGVNGKMVNLYTVDPAKNEVRVQTSKKGKDLIYILTSKTPKGGKEVLEFTDKVASSSDSLVRGAYAAAYVLTQRTKTDKALEILGKVGDKELVDLITNSFTPDEYGNAESRLQVAMSSPSKRFQKGRDTNYLPPADAFCLLDALDVLLADKQACFYPYSDDFVYRRVGRTAETLDGYPKFDARDNVKCAINSLTWNSSRLNLSVLARIEGTIDLLTKAVVDGGESVSPKTVGFSDKYPTFVWRNYTLVRDGFLNVQKLPVSLSRDSFDVLAKHGMVDGTYKTDSIYILDLTVIPVVNRKIAEGRTSATELCRSVMKETEYKAILKTFKWLLNKDKEEDTEAPKTFSDLQKAYLVANGIDPKTNAFSPPTTQVKTDDYYEAKTFDIKVKGLSSIPKIEAVVTKRKESKKLTISETLVSHALSVYEASGVDKMRKDLHDKWLETSLERLIPDMRSVRRKIQETKFAVILGKRFFDEFDKMCEESKLTVDGQEFTVALGTEKVPL